MSLFDGKNAFRYAWHDRKSRRAAYAIVVPCEHQETSRVAVWTYMILVEAEGMVFSCRLPAEVRNGSCKFGRIDANEICTALENCSDLLW